MKLRMESQDLVKVLNRGLTHAFKLQDQLYSFETARMKNNKFVHLFNFLKYMLKSASAKKN